MINTKINIINKKIDDLIPYENNPRHNDEAVDPVSESISTFGYKVPIVIDSKGIVVTGHTRLKALKKLGVESVDCILADDLDEEQIKAFRLVDNKTSELSDWEFMKLEEELASLPDTLDMSLFGFFDVDTDYLDDFFDQPSTETKEKVKDNFKVVVEFDNEVDANEFLEYCKNQNLNCKLED